MNRRYALGGKEAFSVILPCWKPAKPIMPRQSARRHSMTAHTILGTTEKSWTKDLVYGVSLTTVTLMQFGFSGQPSSQPSASKETSQPDISVWQQRTIATPPTR